MIEQATALLGLLAETPIHAGAGQTVGVIDLPIQREAHTAWPCIYGSAVKGAMRTLAEHKEKKDNEKWVTAVFGPPPEGTSDHAGALAVGDARLLLLPVRSLTSHFKWVTCPALLKRFIADCQRLNIMTLSSKSNKESKDDGEVLVSQQDAKIQETLFLEEFRFKVEQTDLSEIIQALTQLMARDDAETVLHEQLAIVSNDMFKHLAEHATPVNAHTAIDNNTKTVKPGALWYEETLPPDTLLY
ncbi:MAG: type III-B CRISPR module RAMP protein Cmr4, partial [Pseudomonadota bacterium]|nr:type III-B CRISPR module RAMP protein Cmr4 [Pseudomonadota bacterium]